MKGLTEQEANKKNIDLKFPGATADLIATKNMFDVFLKTKVLDICGDAMGKENLPEEHWALDDSWMDDIYLYLTGLFDLKPSSHINNHINKIVKIILKGSSFP